MKILCGGELLSNELGQALLQGGDELFNLYGPTETTVWSASARILDCGSIPLGEPVSGTSIYLLDSELRPVLPGMPGEVFISGCGVARGYLGRPDLTAEKFLPDPHGQPGGRMYRTGDRAQSNAADDLVFLGRTDAQVKVRGFRVELGEIEQTLSAHKSVAQCGVVAKEFSGDVRLIAFVTAQANYSIDPAALRRFLATRLPDYAVPSLIVPLLSLPLTPNAKVDRNRLRAHEVVLEQKQEQSGGVPRTLTEAMLSRIWADMLGGDAPGIYDNFFSASGHSLLAGRMLARLRDVFGVELPLSAIFESPTIVSLAERIDASLGQSTDGPVRHDASAGSVWPLAPAQERLWFLHQIEPGSPDYNMVLAFRLRAVLNRNSLREAVYRLARRHSILSSRFFSFQGETRQQPNACLPEISFADLSAEPDAQNLAIGTARQEAARPFDLTTGPVFRVAVSTLSAEDHVIVLVIHHIAADGWSLGVLTSELSTHYAFACGVHSNEPPDPAIQYFDFAIWQREWLERVADSQVEFWRQHLRNAPPLQLPAAHEGEGGGRLVIRLPETLTSELNAFGTRHNLTLFMLHLTAFHAVLYGYTRQEDQVVGTDLAYRRWPATENLIGFFVNSVPLRLDLSRDPSLLELALRVRKTSLAAYAHQDLPFDRIVEAAGLRGNREAPPVNALVVSQELGWDARQVRSVDWEPIEMPPATPKFKLCLFAGRSDGAAALTWLWQRAHMSEAVIREMARRHEMVLKMLTEDGNRRLDSVRWSESGCDPLATLGTHRRSSRSSNVNAVSTELLRGGSTAAVLVRPQNDNLDGCGWARAQRPEIQQYLDQHGAVLFRGFRIESEGAFEDFAGVLCSPLFAEYGDLPRPQAQGRIYHSTPYPAEHRIHYHNESSHLNTWPQKQLFWCAQPAARGGETPLADCREVLRQLPPAIRDAFAEQGLLYVRNFAPKLDVGWREFFQTDDPLQVEEHCRTTKIECAWTDSEHLTLYARRPAVVKHPRTGDPLFFNQIQVHHPSCLPPPARESLASLFGPGDLPRNVLFGDGFPILDDLVRHVQDVYDRVALVFPWERGDVLLIDNMRVAHARNPFEGPRRILVAMGEMAGNA